MSDVRIIGELKEGEEVQMNGQILTVDDIRTDPSGSYQITLLSKKAMKLRGKRGKQL